MEFKTISASDFMELLNSGKALNIIDVRNKPEHGEKHLIAPHKNIPAPEFDPYKFGDPANTEERLQTVYIMCGGGSRSGRVASQLAGKGFENAISVSGGIRALIGQGAEIAGKDIKSAVTCKSGS